MPRGNHTLLRFVTTCDNGVFIWGGRGGSIYAPLNKFSHLICRYKATLKSRSTPTQSSPLPTEVTKVRVECYMRSMIAWDLSYEG